MNYILFVEMERLPEDVRGVPLVGGGGAEGEMWRGLLAKLQEVERYKP